MLSVRPLTYDDYEKILAPWWLAHSMDAPARAFLPDEGEGGLLVSNEDGPICAGFVYTTNSKAAWCTWIISTPSFCRDKKNALRLLLATMVHACREVGYSYIYAPVKSKALLSVYRDIGFVEGDTNNVDMIYKLNNI